MANGIGPWLHCLQELAQSCGSAMSDPQSQSSAMWRTAVADQVLRQYNIKPRLSDEAVRQLQNAFKDAQLASVQAQAFVDCNLGGYAEVARTIGRGRRPFLMSCGHLGVGPSEVQSGDEVVVVRGADVPFVVRRKPSGGGHVLLGEAYVHGYMDGEALVGAVDAKLLLH